ncbi:MAG: GTPase domain-containing protein [Methylococcales bacterium]|nr:GTPase domain-containing protein [Methylococcales bacterium]
MLEFITQLRQRYHVVLSANSTDTKKYQPIFEQLTLAQAFLKKSAYLENLPLSCAIIGPTQAGKSSLTNVFLQSQNAEVSALAGYTVHPQGFCHNVKLKDCENVVNYFSPFKQVETKNLDKNQPNCFAITQTEKSSHLLPSCIFWDTPDFDSIDSTDYREGVLKTIALADIIILAVSKEKYADQTVWDTLKLIEPLRQPTLICINKLSEGSEDIILQSLKEKWHDYRHDAFPAVLPLLYQPTTKSPEIPHEKQRILFDLAKKVQREKHSRREQKFVQTHWAEWTQPLRAEHEIYDSWQSVVDKTIDESLKNYQRDYLNHPHHYETFKQAIAELLLLLEIPSVARIMVAMRNPFKKLRRLFGSRSNSSTMSNEMNVLTQLLNHTLTELAHELLDKNTPSMWRELSEQLRQNRPALLQEFNHAAETYHQNFQQDVELAAQGLYQKLEEQPLVLNALRATRITADAAIVALTLYTGGIGLHDLAIAPAMLMLTNFLTESAIGSYMKKVESDLKAQQFNAVKNQIFSPLSQRLYALPQEIKTDTHFAISPSQLADIEATFDEKPHGLRLL